MAMLFLILQAVTCPFERRSHNILKCFELFVLVLFFQTVMVIQLTRNDNPCSAIFSNNATEVGDSATCDSQPNHQCKWIEDPNSCQWLRLCRYDNVLCSCLAGLFLLVAGFTASALHQVTIICANLVIGNVGFDRRIGVEITTLDEDEQPQSHSQLNRFKRLTRRSPSHDSTGSIESAESGESSVFSGGSAAVAETTGSTDAMQESTCSDGSSNSSGAISGGY